MKKNRIERYSNHNNRNIYKKAQISIRKKNRKETPAY